MSSSYSCHGSSFQIPPSLAKESKEVSYHDYSIISPPPSLDLVPDNGRGTTQTFPRKLHYLLEYARTSNDGLRNIVSWQPHGRCFVVHNNKEFVAQVLPNWFMQSKIASFQRQLNLYGFKRFTTGTDKGGYYHECFLRGRPDLVLHIRRTKVKGAGHRKAAIPGSEPNFYRQFPLPEKDQTPSTTSTSASGVFVPAMPAAAPLSTGLLPHLQEPHPSLNPTMQQEQLNLIPVQNAPLNPLPEQAQPIILQQEQPQMIPLQELIPLQEQNQPIQMQETYSMKPNPAVQCTQLQEMNYSASELDISTALTACCTEWLPPPEEDDDDDDDDTAATMVTGGGSDTDMNLDTTPGLFSTLNGNVFFDSLASLKVPIPLTQDHLEKSPGNSQPEIVTAPHTGPMEEDLSCSKERKPKDLDSSLLLLGQQQGLFSGHQPSPSLANTFWYGYQNHDIIVDALRASAPFYPESGGG
ncbi:shock factor protein [Seminavis robusta]|uniref:Shock factor protein n=1 Tax=Seminavis robusta TaxID=568900 RepID=A0A9N8HXS5_9STRA|nr:shock factor protein [Seminavis robusta]|eukprot:Sro2561_g331300.1 shock factor protein (467) ;mRNA; r:3632-5480